VTQPKYEHPYRSGDWTREFYPMPAFPSLTVSDAERSSRWYQDALGFVDVYTMRLPHGAPAIVHLRWCRFGDLLLVPALSSLEAPRGAGVTVNFSADDVDVLAERVRAAGVAIEEGPIDRPWKTRDLTLRDPDGYRLNFTAPQAALLQRVAAGTAPTMAEIEARLRGNRRDG
jgi:catechol 2,3-dioxygenase-like lactoylglutathione lyase family enzyme